jgi:vitamin B12 transporter
MRKIFSVAAIMISSHLLAQQDSTKSLDEVVISANKFQQKQSTTGKVITVITKEQLEKSAGRTLSQLLNEQVGVLVNGSYNNMGSNQALYMRGASTGRTLVLIDGVPVNDPSLINNEVDLNLFSLNNIERIEICRGAQSTLYGSDAIAGVVNIITVKNNVSRPFNVKGSLSGGNFGTFRSNIQLYGKEGKLTYVTRYARLTTDGFSAAYDSTGTKNFDKDGYKGNAAHAALQFEVNPELSFKGFVQYNQYKADIDQTIFSDEQDYTINNKNWITGTGFRYIKNGISLVGNYQYSTMDRNYFNDSLHRPGFTKFSTDDYAGKNHFAEIFAKITMGKRFDILQGADYRSSSMHSNYYSLSSFGPYTSAFKDTSMSQASLYASLLYHSLDERLNIEAGGRLNVHSRYGSNHTYTFNPSYAILSGLRVFGSIATAFKAPTLYQLYSAYGRLDLKGETSTTYEIGLQQTHSMIQSRAVFFKRLINDGLDFDYIGFKYFNFLKQTVNGLELEVKVNPTKGLSLSANYAYLKAEERTQSRVNFKDTTYTYLLRRPKHNLNVIAAYQFENGLYISTTAKYISSRFDIGGYKKQDVEMDGYFLVNAYAEYAFNKHLKAFADVQNAGKNKFFDIRGYNSIPRIINAGITFEF